MIKMIIWFFLLGFCALMAGIALGVHEPAGGWLTALVVCVIASVRDYNRLFVSPEL